MRDRILTIALVLAVSFGFVAVSNQPAPGALAQGTFYREVVLDSANVITADEQSSASGGFADADLAAFQLVCTEDSGTATLDSAIQRSVDGGTTWADIVAFTQLSAGGAETKLYADVRAASAQMIGDLLRVDHDVTGTGQYTCTVSAAAEG